MTFSDYLFRMRDITVRGSVRLRKLLGLSIKRVPFRVYAAHPDERAELAESVSGDLAKIYFNHHGRVIHKWLHYLEAYDKNFSRYRNTSVKMLEIGVFQGGSLELWREYFGPQATIFGVDIDPECANRVNEPNQVRIGSQDDAAFLVQVVEEMGAPDIILDDGSHVSRHQLASFSILFPLLKDGGLYVIEDLHTAYWPGFYEGGYRRSNTAIGLIKQIIDDLHSWYHERPTSTPAKEEISAIHVYDSIVFVEKKKKIAPRHIMVE
jgi:hypothetical protein